MTNLKTQSVKKVNKTSNASKIINNVKKTKTTEKKPMSYNNYNYKKTFSELPEVTYTIEPDWDLLLGILKQRRYSKSEAQDIFVDELQAFFDAKDAITSRDNYGNLYVVKGEAAQYRCMVAHTDINQAIRDRVHLYMNNEWIFGFDMDEGCQAGMGADDGVGIAIAIEMFNRFDTIKLFFPKDEEVGMHGSTAADKSFFSDCTMILQPDRRSFTNDLVTFTNGIETCSQEFVDAASEISLKYGYAAARGIATDIGSLKRSSLVNCIACNVSCGYAHEHSDKEVISRQHYRNAMNYIYDLLVGMGEVKWEHVYVAPVYIPPAPTSARQGNLFEEDEYDYAEFYSGRYGQNYWYGDSNKDYTPKEAKTKVFDIKGREEVGKTKFKSDADAIDEWYWENYPEFIEEEGREKLKHYKCNDFYLTSALPPQIEIDNMIEKNVCPCCRNKIIPDNILFLNTVCQDCFSTFNIPEEDYAYLTKSQGEA
jgi:hypothetical protein